MMPLKIDVHKLVVGVISVVGAIAIWYYVKVEALSDDSLNNCLNNTQEENIYSHDNRKRNTGDCSK